MKSHSCGWRIAHGLGRRSFGIWGGRWRQGKPRLRDERTNGTESYWNHVANAASFEAFNRHEETLLLSTETISDNRGLIDFKTFAQEYPDRLFPLLEMLRPEFQELFIESYMLGKGQVFLGKTHGCIQTRIWQQLRIIEQAVGSLILLGTNPNAEIIQPILRKAGLDETPYGSLTFLILKYAETQNYAEVASRVSAPVPAIRKIFRPAIATLLADKDVHAVAVGAYLRNLTHHASLTGAGLSKRCVERTQRMKAIHFHAEPIEESPLISFGRVDSLQETPWCLFEISSEHRMVQIYPQLLSQGKRIFGQKASQIYAPINEDGELAFGYIFVRSMAPKLVKALMCIRGISEMATVSSDDGTFTEAVTIPHKDVLTMMGKYTPPAVPTVHVGEFVEILTGDAAHYCGVITSIHKVTKILKVEVNFPTGRQFLIFADARCVKLLPKVPKEKQGFWGVRLNSTVSVD